MSDIKLKEKIQNLIKNIDSNAVKSESNDVKEIAKKFFSKNCISKVNDTHLKDITRIIIQDATGIEAKDDEDFEKDCGMDSITRMELLMSLEDAFDVSIEDNDAADLTCITKTVKLIKFLSNKKSV